MHAGRGQNVDMLRDTGTVATHSSAHEARCAARTFPVWKLSRASTPGLDVGITFSMRVQHALLIVRTMFVGVPVLGSYQLPAPDGQDEP